MNPRFWKKVDKNGPIKPHMNTVCWLWTGATNRDGYGNFRCGNKVEGAHRVAWEQANGPIPEGKEICHSCDTPNCVRAEHFFLGDRLSNMQDAASKNRFQNRKPVTGDRHGARLHPESVRRGAENGAATLTEQQVAAVRMRYDAGETQTKLAESFGVSQMTISRVVRGVTYK